MNLVERLDRYQRRHRRAGVPIAVVYKFNDDQGGYLAALVTYYGFVSLVPLLLLSSTILSFVLEGNEKLQQQVLNSALGQFPLVGEQLADPHGVTGSGIGLVIGILGTIYGGMGAAQAGQNAMNVIWRVPRNSRPNPLRSRLRSIELLLIVGLAVLVTTGLSALGATASAFGTSIGAGIQILLTLGSLAVNAGVFTLGFRIATARHVPWRGIVPGAIAASIGWQILQFGGTAYVGHVVKNASVVNSVFALILGLIAWIYLGALVVVICAEANVVRFLKLYPRALLTPFTDNVELTSADEEIYTDQAQAQRAKGFEDITVSFDPPKP